MICRRCGNRIPEYLTTREYFQCPECGRQFGNPPAEDDRRGYAAREPRYERPDAGVARRTSRFEPEYDDSPADSSYYDDGSRYDENDGYDEPYYDDQPYQDDYYDEQGYDDDGYYDEQGYGDDGYYDEQGYGGDGYYDEQGYGDGDYDGQGYGDGDYDGQSYDDDSYYDEQPWFDDSADYSDDFITSEPKKRAKRTPKAKQPRGPQRTMKMIWIVYVLIVEIVLLIVCACIHAGRDTSVPAKYAPTDAPTAIEATADPDATDNPYPVV